MTAAITKGALYRAYIAAGFTARETAERFGVSRQAVNQATTNRANHLDRLKKIKRRLNGYKGQPYRCSRCGQDGHQRRTCGVRPAVQP